MSRASSRVVIAASAPLWATPEAASEAQAFAEHSYASYHAGVRGLLASQTSLQGRLDTVAIAGEQVRILESVDDSLISVELLAQPNGETGYVGFMNAAHVGNDPRQSMTHVVIERGVVAEHVNRSSSVELAAATTVELLERRPNAEAVVLLSSGEVLSCPMAKLRRIDAPLDAAQVLRIAMSFLGVPYLWGGTEGAGIDCSGLVHTAARIGGRVLPRDAHHQWAATAIDAGWDDLKLGDILYFGEGATLEGIDHVGLYAGDGWMLHAPETGREVILEPISDRARERNVAFGRFDRSGDN